MVSIAWKGEKPLVKGRTYQLKSGNFLCNAEVLQIKHPYELKKGGRLSVEHLYAGETGLVDLALSKDFTVQESGGCSSDICWLCEGDNKGGEFQIKHVLRRSTNVVWQETDVNRKNRADLKKQYPQTFWFTGLSGSGKSTLANELEKRLVVAGCHTMLLDGDNVRHGLCKNLGFKEVDRIENVRRVAEVAKLMNDAGLIVLAAFIAPYLSDRAVAKEIIGECFVEIHVSTPLEECERRDIKGLYAKARTGQIPNFTGVNAPYEVPDKPDVVIDTSVVDIDSAVDNLMQQFVSSNRDKYFEK